jgi:hypothetical protein
MIGQGMLPPNAPSPPSSNQPSGIPTTTASLVITSDFQKAFLLLMADAGEVMGKAAAKELAAIQFTVGGGSTPAPSPPPQVNDGMTKFRPPPGNINTLTSHSFRQLIERTANATRYGEAYAKFQGAKSEDARSLGRGLGALAAPLGIPSAAYFTGRALTGNERKHSEYSPSLAANYAISDVRRIFREIKLGEGVANTNRDLLKEVDRMSDSIAVIEKMLTNVANSLLTPVLRNLNQAIDWAKQKFGMQDEPVPMTPWQIAINQAALAQEARDAQARKLNPKAMLNNNNPWGLAGVKP